MPFEEERGRGLMPFEEERERVNVAKGGEAGLMPPKLERDG